MELIGEEKKLMLFSEISLGVFVLRIRMMMMMMRVGLLSSLLPSLRALLHGSDWLLAVVSISFLRFPVDCRQVSLQGHDEGFSSFPLPFFSFHRGWRKY